MTERDDIECMLVRMEERLAELRPAKARVYAYLWANGTTRGEPVEIEPEVGAQNVTFTGMPSAFEVTGVLLRDELGRNLWTMGFDRTVTVCPGDTVQVTLNFDLGF